MSREIQTQLESLQKESSAILGEMGTHTTSLGLVIRLLPDGASVESLTQVGRQLTVDGKAADYATAVRYIAALEKSGVFSTVTIRNIAMPNTEKTEVTFNLELSQK